MADTAFPRVVVLKGGWSAERAVSLVSGAAVAKALAEAGYRVAEVDVVHDLPALLAALTPAPDVVFNALHGRGGEDGVVQGVLEMLGIPYTHSGVAASAVAMSKVLTKRALAAAGIRSPDFRVVPAAEAAAAHVLEPPYVVKPVAEGSSVGVRVVGPMDNAPPLDPAGWAFGAEVLVEAYIPGRELTVGVMGDRALTVTEIHHSHGFFDYDAKYVQGHATHLLPAPVPPAVFRAAMDQALQAHRLLGCAGISRSDFRYDDSKPGLEGLFFLELNTQPGFTPISLVPEQAEHVGISFRDLCIWLVETAQCHG
ncbi:MAG: D-alanine--D-alanine ligase [Alphaproteobacteria bacterium]|jgi:D-alanine-D-alanine ligase|nr:D-alanine--D-alanine ligase [Alphaproteobacteria bacterium]